MSEKTSDPKGPDLARRALLRRIGLAGTVAYIAPALTALGAAHASGGGSGGGADGGGGGGSGPGGSGPGGSGPGGSGPGGSGPGGSGPSGGASAPSGPNRSTTSTRTGADGGGREEMLVSLPAGQPLNAVEALGYRVLGARENVALSRRLIRLELPAGRSVAQASAEIAAAVPGAVSDRNHVYRTDEFLCADGDCAAHEMISWSGWPSAFAPRIGMIDTGINVDHEALVGQKLTVIQADIGDRNAAGRQHGTAVAALLIGRMNSRVPGLLPMAELIAVEAFHRGSGGERADAFSLANAIDLLLARGVSVINLSFSGPENAILREVTERAAAQSVVLVAAAGNGGAGAAPAYPAAWPHVIAVTAVDRSGRIYRQANQGPYISLAAPGVGVWTAASVSGGRLKSGTSYAVPFVTASIAVQRMRAPRQSVSQTVSQLLSCAQDLGAAGFDPVYGHGLLSAPGYCKGEASEIFSVSGE